MILNIDGKISIQPLSVVDNSERFKELRTAQLALRLLHLNDLAEKLLDFENIVNFRGSNEEVNYFISNNDYNIIISNYNQIKNSGEFERLNSQFQSAIRYLVLEANNFIYKTQILDNLTSGLCNTLLENGYIFNREQNDPDEPDRKEYVFQKDDKHYILMIDYQNFSLNILQADHANNSDFYHADWTFSPNSQVIDTIKLLLLTYMNSSHDLEINNYSIRFESDRNSYLKFEIGNNNFDSNWYFY